jgi:sulfate transport system ATP-binding protein
MEGGAGMSVRVVNLTKRFTARGTPAVEDVTFEAPTGAITSVIGPSGAGKSTILRVVAGLEIPDQGQIVLDGEDVTARPVQQRGVGLVFQSYALFQHMTVRDNIAFGLDVRRRSRAEIKDRVDELLELIQLEEYGRRLPSQLSGGQRQRVAFARALAIQPKVLLLDEPFGALDARVRVDLREWLHRFHDETHVTTLLVTHDQAEAFELSQHVVLMFDGRVAQAGPPLEVYDHPATPAVAEFFGASVFRGRVRDGRAEVGPFAVDVPRPAREGDEVHAYVRPDDVRIAPVGNTDPTYSQADILKVRPVGSLAKITLRLSNGEETTVEMPRAEFDRLGVGDGDRVLLDVRSARVFVGDYSI